MTRTARMAYGAVALSAALFGAAFPLAKILLKDVQPLGLAGLLYLASGLGIGALRMLLGRQAQREASLNRRDTGWLVAVILSGGVLGPILLLFGLERTPAHVSALLANTETIFTTLIAVLFFGDYLMRREVAGTILIVAGATAVALVGTSAGGSLRWQGPVLLVAAGLAWGLDNNFTQRLSARDPLQIASLKGTVAGVVNLSLAAVTGSLPQFSPRTLVFGFLVGVFCCGLSIVLFVVGLRHVGAARTSALFATAPGMAVALSWVVLGERPMLLTVIGGVVMIAGAWLLIRAEHTHRHVHEPVEHEHRHVHDEHHQHAHRGDEGPEPHSHPHCHERLEHEHPHVSDLHHQHRHS